MWVGLLAVLVSGSCAKQAVDVPKISSLRAHEINVLAVRSKPYEYRSDFSEPAKSAGSGAASGAGQATASVARQCATTGGDPAVGLLCIAFLPVAGVAGALFGAGASHSESEVTEATAVLKRTLAASTPVTGIETAVLGQLRAVGVDQFEVRNLSRHEASIPNFELAQKGLDTVLDLEVSRLDLAVFGRIDPDAAVVFVVYGTVINTETGPISPTLSWAYYGGRHDYFDLAEDDARLLRDSINQSYEEVSEMIVADLF